MAPRRRLAYTPEEENTLAEIIKTRPSAPWPVIRKAYNSANPQRHRSVPALRKKWKSMQKAKLLPASQGSPNTAASEHEKEPLSTSHDVDSSFLSGFPSRASSPAGSGFFTEEHVELKDESMVHAHRSSISGISFPGDIRFPGDLDYSHLEGRSLSMVDITNRHGI